MPNTFIDRDGLDAKPRPVGGPPKMVVMLTPQIHEGLQTLAEQRQYHDPDDLDDNEIAALRWIDLLGARL